jgi:hypothetical protein
VPLQDHQPEYHFLFVYLFSCRDNQHQQLQRMSTTVKLIILFICFVLSLVGFLIKIPVPLRGHDKFLHGAFYFLAAAFLNILFKKRQVLIFVLLALFGVLIEYLQPLCNKLTHSKIHGRFDIEDIYANIKGLVLYALLALIFFGIKAIYKYSQTTDSNDSLRG